MYRVEFLTCESLSARFLDFISLDRAACFVRAISKNLTVLNESIRCFYMKEIDMSAFIERDDQE